MAKVTLEDAKNAVRGHLALVEDGHLSLDDANDAILDYVNALEGEELDEAYDYYEQYALSQGH